ncbi:MAG: sulfatase-like hydrolase/transferase, partial [Planctomycetaceae bacterium]|nr:sulfatase-like hydrolase/transferase [Planctomycetaceae bacterium]
LIRNNTVLKRMLAEDQTRMVTEYTAEAVKFIEGHQDGPFFLYLPHSAVHFPLYPGKEFQGRTGHGLYSDWVEEVDWSVGKVLDAVRESKNSKKTFVMFTSDNGGSLRHGAVNKPLRGGKGSTLEGGMRVPTIAWWPGKIPAGTATPEVAGMFDMLPTLVGLADGKLPQDRTLDGRDIWPLLSGEENAKTPHDVFYYFRGLNLEAVRRGDWKLRLKDGELYNLDQDIAEANNVAKNNADIVSELTQLAAAMDSDLGQTDKGPGCRPLGHVDNARPIISDDGRVRKDMQFEPPLTGE